MVQQTEPDAPTIFGFTPGALFAGFALSMLGVAYLRFARSTGEPIIAVLGLVLLVVPFFLTNVWWLLGIGTGVVALTFVLRRLIRY